MEPNQKCPVVNIQPKIYVKGIWKDMQIATIEIPYKWTIEGIRRNINDAFFSPKFCAEGYENTIWEIALDKDKFNVSIQLLLYGSDMWEVEARYIFSILNKNDKLVNHLIVKENRHFRIESEHGFTNFINTKDLLDPKNGLLVDDTLSIKCVVQFTSYDPSILKPLQFNEIKISEYKLSENLGQLVANNKFSDAVLVVDGKELPAHKYILSLRSKVFAAMFEHDMEEKRQNRVIITDIDYEVFKEMLHFFYTGRAPKLNEMAFELLVAADKYDVQRLKLMCEEKISESITVENGVEMLKLSETYNTSILEATVIRYLKQKGNEEAIQTKLEMMRQI